MAILFSHQREIIRYCAEEVQRQRAEPIAVYWMLEAWDQAHDRCMDGKALNSMTIAGIGITVEPEKNRYGYRIGQVEVGAYVPPPGREVRRLMDRFAENLPNMTPREAYLEFEAIHPFYDGNGRTGKIILNYLSGTLDDPYRTEIPNPWGIANP